MKIVLASSEAVPFAKTGGLADVVTALAKSLNELGHETWLFLPYYSQIWKRSKPRDLSIEPTGHSLEIPILDRDVNCRLLWAKLPESQVRVILVEQDEYYDREQLYNADGKDYADNCERFVYFSRAVLESCRVLQLQPDVIHANDWQTGLIPALLKLEYQQHSEFARTASLFTIHNMAFQGAFWHWDMKITGIDWKHFNMDEMEAYGQLNLLKTGVVYADYVTAVSPTYAQEIQTPDYGCGLHEVLKAKAHRLVGILNGIDTNEWNPAGDPHLPQHYSAEQIAPGKPGCKSALQNHYDLPVQSDVPLFGMISRMTEQKGIDLILNVAAQLLERNLQLVFLGTGQPEFESALKQLASRYPHQVGVEIGFNESLAHLIEAGSDLYLMPSRYEPCGLNQMYSMRYGTIPIVHRVGGLADSVTAATAENLATGTATGFQITEFTAEAFLAQVDQALQLYHQKPNWQQLMKTGMLQDWSWRRSAADYLSVYRQAHALHNPVETS